MVCVAFELVQRLCDFATRYATLKIHSALFETTKWQYSGIEDGENMEKIRREYGESMALWNGNNAAFIYAVHRELLSI